jgi:hypothetical protein
VRHHDFGYNFAETISMTRRGKKNSGRGRLQFAEPEPVSATAVMQLKRELEALLNTATIHGYVFRMVFRLLDVTYLVYSVDMCEQFFEDLPDIVGQGKELVCAMTCRIWQTRFTNAADLLADYGATSETEQAACDALTAACLAAGAKMKVQMYGLHGDVLERVPEATTRFAQCRCPITGGQLEEEEGVEYA